MVETLEKGKTYQSRNFPHISRKVQRVKDGVVVYSIIDDRHPEGSWRRMATAPVSEFMKVSTCEVKK